MLVLALLIGFVVAVTATPVVAAIARRYDRVVAPSPDRWHVRPTALFGGVAIAAGYLAAVGAVAIQEASTVWVTDPQIRFAPTAGILAAGLVMLGAGVADDILRLRPPTKLVLQAAAAAVLVSFGLLLDATPFHAVNLALTLLWFIAITNALNLLDNMDGVSSGVAAIAGIGFAAVFANAGQPVLAALSLALAGAAAGFLVFNFRPAKIFMGDAGSLLLGSSLAGLGAAYSQVTGSSRAVGIGVPVLLLAVPIIDMALVTYTRTTARQAIAMGGRDHVAHRLVGVGLSERFVALMLYAVAAVGALLAVHSSGDTNAASLWASATFAIGMAMFAAYLGRLYTYPQNARPVGRVWFLVEDLLYRRRLLEVLLDTMVFAVAYWGAYLLRWDGSPPQQQRAALMTTIGIAVAAKSVSFMFAGVYRGLWQRVSVADVHRIIRASLLGAVATAAAVVLLFPGVMIPRSIFVLDLLVVVVLSFGVRLTFRSLDRLRQRILPRGIPTLVYGAGAGGDLAVREVVANAQLGLLPIGFIDDDIHKAGMSVHGLPVHYAGRDLTALLRGVGAQRVIIGARQIGEVQLERLRVACRSADVEMLELRIDIVSAKQSSPGADIVAEHRRWPASVA